MRLRIRHQQETLLTVETILRPQPREDGTPVPEESAQIPRRGEEIVVVDTASGEASAYTVKQVQHLYGSEGLTGIDVYVIQVDMAQQAPNPVAGTGG